VSFLFTAAHCVFNKSHHLLEHFEVILGMFDLSEMHDTQPHPDKQTLHVSISECTVQVFIWKKNCVKVRTKQVKYFCLDFYVGRGFTISQLNFK
jgi:hypothetical protein